MTPLVSRMPDQGIVACPLLTSLSFQDGRYLLGALDSAAWATKKRLGCAAMPV